MGFTVSSLSNYTNEQNLTMYMPSMFKGITSQFANIQTGIKSAEKIKLLDNTIFMQSGGSCSGHNPSGTTTISDRTLTVGKIKVDNSWCIEDLEAKSTQLMLKQGSMYNEQDLPQQILDSLVARLMEKLEVQDWQGDTTGGDPNLNKYDGIHTILVAAGTTKEANVAAYVGTPLTSVTTSNAITAFDGIRLAQTALVPGLRNNGNNYLFVPTAWSEAYLIAAKNANYFDYSGNVNTQDGTFKLLGTNITIVPTIGLDGADAAYLIHENNLFLGTDMENEEEKFKIWYEDKDEKVYSTIKFKRGWQVLYPAEVVSFTI